MKKKDSSKRKRGEGVLLEDLDSKLDILVEGQLATNDRLDSLEGRFDGLDDKVDKLQTEMNYKFEAVFDELHLIRNELKEKVSRDEFIVLEKRFMMLDKKATGKK